MENKQINQDILTRRAEENVKSVQKIADINLKAVILQGQSAMKSVLLRKYVGITNFEMSV